MIIQYILIKMIKIVDYFILTIILFSNIKKNLFLR